MNALDVRALNAGYRGVPVVRDLDLAVEAGEVVALIGPNGAGKSTVLWTVGGILPPLRGDITIFGRKVAGLSPHRIARLGTALVPDDRGIFHQLTILENLRIRNRHRSRAALDGVFATFPRLAELSKRRAGLLSGGEQQMLALSCALVSEPRLLMIDEMSLGLAPIIVERLLPLVRELASTSGTAVLIVEQHVAAALDVSDRAYVLRHGELVAHGAAHELAADRHVLEASYLGTAIDKLEPQMGDTELDELDI